MKTGVDWKEASTMRGVVWISTAVIGAVMAYQGKDVQPLLLLAAAVVGGLGVMVKD